MSRRNGVRVAHMTGLGDAWAHVQGTLGQKSTGNRHLRDRLSTSRRGAATLRDQSAKSAKSLAMAFAARCRSADAPPPGMGASAAEIRRAWRARVSELLLEGQKAESDRGLATAASMVVGAVISDTVVKGATSQARPLTRGDYTGSDPRAPTHDAVPVPKQALTGPVRAAQSWPDQGSAKKNPILRSPTREHTKPGTAHAREVSSARYHNLAYEGIRRDYMAQSVKVAHWAVPVSIGPGASHFVARGDYQSGAGRLVYQRSESTVGPTRAGSRRGPGKPL